MATKYQASICIEVDSSLLLSLHYGRHKVEGFNVEYRDTLQFDSIKDALGRIGEFYFPKILMTKSSEYRVENEYRSNITMIDCQGRIEKNNHEAVRVPIDMQNRYVDVCLENRG